MNCSLSGEPCENPVVSQYGHIYEKSLIEKHILEHGTCPITNNELKKEDLITLMPQELPVRPRPASATSLASLLKLFQNEWDSVMLETFNVKKQCENLKQELSNSLYQYDAACRVISRLIKERDDARKALADTQKNMSAVITETKNKISKTKTEASEDQFESIVLEISEFAKTLSKQRKRTRKDVMKNLKPADTIAKYESLLKAKINSDTPTKGASSLELLHPSDSPENVKMLVGCFDGAVKLIDFAFAQNGDTVPKIETFKHHNGKISGICLIDSSSNSLETFVSASEDSRIALWKRQTGGVVPQNGEPAPFCVAAEFSHHSKAVTGLSLQAMKRHIASCSLDGTWALFDVATTQCLRASRASSAEDSSSAYHCLSFHPDGLIFGAGGVDRTVQIWDLKSQQNVASFSGHSGTVTSLSFSENGYYLASADDSGVVKTWDLRKSENLSSLSLEGPVTQVRFDESGGYFGCVGSFGASLYASKNWSLVKSFEEGKKTAAVDFGSNCAFLVSSLPDEDELVLLTAKDDK